MKILLNRTGGFFNWLGKDFELRVDGRLRGLLSFCSWNEVELRIDDKQFAIRSDEKARWRLEQGGVKMASATRQALGRELAFTIGFEDRSWQLRSDAKKTLLRYEIRELDSDLGRIWPRIGLWRPSLSAEVEADAPLELVCFAIWLVGIHWVGIAGKFTAARAELGA